MEGETWDIGSRRVKGVTVDLRGSSFPDKVSDVALREVRQAISDKSRAE